MAGFEGRSLPRKSEKTENKNNTENGPIEGRIGVFFMRKLPVDRRPTWWPPAAVHSASVASRYLSATSADPTRFTRLPHLLLRRPTCFLLVPITFQLPLLLPTSSPTFSILTFSDLLRLGEGREGRESRESWRGSRNKCEKVRESSRKAFEQV